MNWKSIASTLSVVVLAMATAAAALVHSPAVAQEMVLCSPPLTADCVDPRWGQIDPSSLVGGGSASDASSPMALRSAGQDSPIAVRMQPTEMRREAVGPPANARIKAELDVTARFAKETAALTAAVKRARFDGRGNLVRGEEQIAAAAQIARQVPQEYALTLYVKAPTRLDAKQRELLENKLASINRILVRRAGRGDPSKPNS